VIFTAIYLTVLILVSAAFLAWLQFIEIYTLKSQNASLKNTVQNLKKINGKEIVEHQKFDFIFRLQNKETGENYFQYLFADKLLEIHNMDYKNDDGKFIELTHFKKRKNYDDY